MPVLFGCNGFWQLIAALHTLKQRNEVLVAVIEDLAGKALHLAFNGTTAAEKTDKAIPPPH